MSMMRPHLQHVQIYSKKASSLMADGPACMWSSSESQSLLHQLLHSRLMALYSITLYDVSGPSKEYCGRNSCKSANNEFVLHPCSRREKQGRLHQRQESFPPTCFLEISAKFEQKLLYLNSSPGSGKVLHKSLPTGTVPSREHALIRPCETWSSLSLADLVNF